MATLYFVSGNMNSYPKTTFDIRVVEGEGYKKTDKTYSKKGSRVLLSDIGRLNTSYDYQIILDDKDKVDDAKRRIMDYLMNKCIVEIDRLREKYEAVEKYRIDNMQLVDLVRDKDCTHEELTMIDAQRGYCNKCGSKVSTN